MCGRSLVIAPSWPGSAHRLKMEGGHEGGSGSRLCSPSELESAGQKKQEPCVCVCVTAGRHVCVCMQGGQGTHLRVCVAPVQEDCAQPFFRPPPSIPHEKKAPSAGGEFSL